MRLKRVQVRNFRSLKTVDIEFEPQCRVLVGINESGKTNILRALSLLDPNTQPKPEDLREISPSEPPDAEAFVRFVFALDEEDREEILSTIKERALTAESTPLLIRGSRRLTLNEVCETRTEGLYTVDLRDRRRWTSMWRFDSDYKVAPSLWKASPQCPPNQPIDVGDGTKANLRSFALVAEDWTEDVPPDFLSKVELKDVTTAIGKAVGDYVQENLPPCIYWSYSEEFLLPAQISLSAFRQNPDSCVPLKHMFALAGHEDCRQAIEEAQSRPLIGMRNLLNRVADRTTKHLRDVWKDHRGTRIDLTLNGDHILPNVQERYNYFDFAKRSDGFKRFVSFLLLVSAKVKTRDLVDTLYLHDEPDVSLHPSGARYLRDELVQISRNNYVVYSTHSPFMIDKELLRRHLIITKQNEVTTATEVNESNVMDEEVIFNAIGYSVFEHLKKRNIIFEGWRDKKLCRVALSASTAVARKLNASFKEVGMCHAVGVKDIGRVTSMLELGDRYWIVVSDADRPAREKQSEYHGDGPWFRYDELLPSVTAVTGEDFIKVGAFEEPVARVVATLGLQPAEKWIDFQKGRPRLESIRAWFAKLGLSGDELKKQVEFVKEEVTAHLTVKQVDEQYYELLEALARKVKEHPAK